MPSSVAASDSSCGSVDSRRTRSNDRVFGFLSPIGKLIQQSPRFTFLEYLQCVLLAIQLAAVVLPPAATWSVEWWTTLPIRAAIPFWITAHDYLFVIVFFTTVAAAASASMYMAYQVMALRKSTTSGVRDTLRNRVALLLIQLLTGPLMVPVTWILAIPFHAPTLDGIGATSLSAYHVAIMAASGGVVLPWALLCVSMGLFNTNHGAATRDRIGPLKLVSRVSPVMVVYPLAAVTAAAAANVAATFISGWTLVTARAVCVVPVALASAMIHSIVPQHIKASWCFISSLSATIPLAVACCAIIHPVTATIGLPVGAALSAAIVFRILIAHKIVSINFDRRLAETESASADDVAPRPKSILKDAPPAPRGHMPSGGDDPFSRYIPSNDIIRFAYRYAAHHDLLIGVIRSDEALSDILIRSRHIADDDSAKVLARLSAVTGILTDVMSSRARIGAAGQLNLALFHSIVAGDHEAGRATLRSLEQLQQRSFVARFSLTASVFTVIVSYLVDARQRHHDLGAAGDEDQLATLMSNHHKALSASNSARKQVLKFWTALSAPQPDIRVLLKTSQDFHSAVVETEKYFQVCLKMCRHTNTAASVHVLRTYATYLETVHRNMVAAQLYREQAGYLEKRGRESSAGSSVTTVDGFKGLGGNARRMKQDGNARTLKRSVLTANIIVGLVFVLLVVLFQVRAYFTHAFIEEAGEISGVRIDMAKSTTLVQWMGQIVTDPNVTAATTNTKTSDELRAELSYQFSHMLEHTENIDATLHSVVLRSLFDTEDEMYGQRALRVQTLMQVPAVDAMVSTSLWDVVNKMVAAFDVLSGDPSALDVITSTFVLKNREKIEFAFRRLSDFLGDQIASVTLIGDYIDAGSLVLFIAVIAFVQFFLLRRAFAKIHRDQNSSLNLFLYIPRHIVLQLISSFQSSKVTHTKPAVARPGSFEVRRVTLGANTESRQIMPRFDESEASAVSQIVDEHRYPHSASTNSDVMSLSSTSDSEAVRPDPPIAIFTPTPPHPVDGDLNRTDTPSECSMANQDDAATHVGSIEGNAVYQSHLATFKWLNKWLRWLFRVMAIVYVVGFLILLAVIFLAIQLQSATSQLHNIQADVSTTKHNGRVLDGFSKQLTWTCFGFAQEGNSKFFREYFDLVASMKRELELERILDYDLNEAVLQGLGLASSTSNNLIQLESVAMALVEMANPTVDKDVLCEMSGFTYNYTQETAKAEDTEMYKQRTLFYTNSVDDALLSPEVQMETARAILTDGKYWDSIAIIRGAFSNAMDELHTKHTLELESMASLVDYVVEAQSVLLTALLVLRIAGTALTLVGLVISVRVGIVDKLMLVMEVTRVRTGAIDTKEESSSAVQSPCMSGITLPAYTPASEVLSVATEGKLSVAQSLRMLSKKVSKSAFESAGKSQFWPLRAIIQLLRSISCFTITMMVSSLIVAIAVNSLALYLASVIQEDIAEFNALGTAELDEKNAVWAVYDTVAHRIEQSRLYSQRGEVKYAEKLLASITDFGCVVEFAHENEYISPETLAIVNRVEDSLEYLEYIPLVSSQLTINAYDHHTIIPKLDGFEYDITTELTYDYDKTAYAGIRPHLYTNHTYDATLPAETQHMIARIIQFDEKFSTERKTAMAAEIEMEAGINERTAAAFAVVSQHDSLYSVFYFAVLALMMGLYLFFVYSSYKITRPKPRSRVNIVKQEVQIGMLRRMSRSTMLALVTLGLLLCAFPVMHFVAVHVLLAGEVARIDNATHLATDFERLATAASTLVTTHGASNRMEVELRHYLDEMATAYEAIASDSTAFETIFRTEIDEAIHGVPTNKEGLAAKSTAAQLDLVWGSALDLRKDDGCRVADGVASTRFTPIMAVYQPLSENLAGLAEMFTEQAINISLWIRGAHALIFFGCTVVFGLGYYVIFRRMFRQLSQTESMNLQILSMVPSHVVHSVPVIKDYLERVRLLDDEGNINTVAGEGRNG